MSLDPNKKDYSQGSVLRVDLLSDDDGVMSITDKRIEATNGQLFTKHDGIMTRKLFLYY